MLVPAILKLRQMRNARTGEAQAPKNPEAGPDARLDLSNYDTEAKISGLRKRLGLPEAATAAEIEKAYLEKRSATLDRYSEL